MSKIKFIRVILFLYLVLGLSNCDGCNYYCEIRTSENGKQKTCAFPFTQFFIELELVKGFDDYYKLKAPSCYDIRRWKETSRKCEGCQYDNVKKECKFEWGEMYGDIFGHDDGGISSVKSYLYTFCSNQEMIKDFILFATAYLGIKDSQTAINSFCEKNLPMLQKTEGNQNDKNNKKDENQNLSKKSSKHLTKKKDEKNGKSKEKIISDEKKLIHIHK